LRISELVSLRWSDVDLTSQTLQLTDERGSGRRQQMDAARSTKGRRSRTLPIHSQLRQIFERLPRQADGKLLHGPGGSQLTADMVRRMFVQNVITPLKEQFPTPAGEIGFEQGRLHSFRHYFVSQALLGGASEGEVKDWVGHHDSAMVAHYRHLRSEDSQRKMQKIEFFSANGDPDSPGRSK
jgi:integrase